MRISVIIPTLNEASTIEHTVTRIRSFGPHETIVVDAGSSDGTADLSRRVSDQTLLEDRGLAQQLNAGAEASSGEVLLFAHADTQLPVGSFGAIEAALSDSEVIAGAFRLGFDSDRWPYRLIAVGANLRNRLGFGPFGDQGLFVLRERFFEAGQYHSGVYLEDFELVRRLQRLGLFTVVPLQVRTSVRRWEQKGVFRTLLMHWVMSAAYLLGRRRRHAILDRWMAHLRSVRRSGSSD